MLVLATASPAAAGFYGIGARVEYGNAYLPPTGDAGLTTMLRYREIGGLLGNLLLFATSAPAKPQPSTHTELEIHCTQSGPKSCTSVEYEVTTYPSAKEIEDYERRLAAWDPAVGDAIMRGEAGQALEIDIPLRALGGDTSGFVARLGAPFLHWGPLSVQMAAGWLTFHDVATRTVSATPNELTTTEKVSDYTYTYVGLPVRVQAPIGLTGFGVHAQLDLNIAGMLLDQASPIRAGIQWFGYHAMISVEGVVTGFRPDGASLAAEVALGF